MELGSSGHRIFIFIEQGARLSNHIGPAQKMRSSRFSFEVSAQHGFRIPP